VRILFWGTPDFAVPSLRALMGEGHQIVGVITQPDRPAGRGRRLKPSAVRAAAEEEGLEVLTPERPRGEEFLARIRGLEPELSVVVAYGHILGPEVLRLPDRGSVNVHASLLPELRGAAPVNWAIIRGHDRTGVTIMQMTEGLDEGPILLQRAIPIHPEDTGTGTYLRLAELGAEALVEALALMEAELLGPREQEHEKATYAPKVDRATARIDWSRSPRAVADHIRGMDMVPGAWTLLDDEPVKLFAPGVVDRGQGGFGSAEPGEILDASEEDGLVVATGEGGAVKLAEVQPPGKRRMEASAWIRGAGPGAGERFR
jgi:methionyl-tRNA formyltransferase